MSLEDASVVDACGIELETGVAVLTITDAWDWSDVDAHLIALQNKLDAYFEFIDSGQIWRAYPPARERLLAIDIVARFPLPAPAKALLRSAKEVAFELNVLIRHHTQGAATESAAAG